MKSLFKTLTLVSVMTFGLNLYAQKFAYVDVEYILNSLPEYKSAQAELDKISVQWQKEIESKIAEVDKLYKSYQAEEFLLTEEMKKKRQNEIMMKEKEVKDLQKQRFGVDGDLFKKRQEMVKPIQDKVYNAIKAVSDKEQIMVMFNKSNDMNIVYSNPRYDRSETVIDAVKNAKGK